MNCVKKIMLPFQKFGFRLTAFLTAYSKDWHKICIPDLASPTSIFRVKHQKNTDEVIRNKPEQRPSNFIAINKPMPLAFTIPPNVRSCKILCSWSFVNSSNITISGSTNNLNSGIKEELFPVHKTINFEPTSAERFINVRTSSNGACSISSI